MVRGNRAGLKNVNHCIGNIVKWKIVLSGFHSKWFKPRRISSLSDMMVHLSVVLKRTVVGDSD